MSQVGRPEKLVIMAQKLADSTPDFFETKGPGKGDHASNQFMARLRTLAQNSFGQDLSEFRPIRSAKLAIDFYFPEEHAAVEIAFGLHNPQSEFERDIFKCLLARDAGHPIKRLILVGKPGTLARQEAPGQKAITSFVEKQFDLAIVLYELKRRPEEHLP